MTDEGEPLLHDLNIFLTADQLGGRCWSFGREEGCIYAPFIRFVDGGRLVGYWHPNESGWTVCEGRVALVDEAGVPTTIFDRTHLGADGRILLKGCYRDGAVVHCLREIDPGERAAPYSPDVRLIQQRPAGRRRNLVVLRANAESLHGSWERDVSDKDRSWDLCISYYGSDDTFPPQDFAEYSCLQNQDKKFTAVKKLMHRDSLLWNYDYVMFPDDDLQMKWSDLNIAFSICNEYQLQLAQPSLVGPVNYESCKQKPEFLMRFVTMVELMAPIFSNRALRACIPTFDLNNSGFGIDYVWSRLVDGPLTKIAVIDRVGIVHTRPTGKNYDYEGALAEGWQTATRYGFLDRYSVRELGGILAHKTAS
jgi:hypothetical protein